MRPALIEAVGYSPQTIEKVERLLELLIEIAGHPYLAPRLCLHGGTALNVFHLPMPRLSVDADLTYIGRVPLSEFETERPQLESAMTNLGTSMGYRVTTSSKIEHSGRIYKLRYRYGDQSDLIKVDFVYLNRAPLLPAETATCFACSPEVGVTTLALPELVAGKTKAMFDRLAIRDLYDIHRVQASGLPEQMANGDADQYRLQRRIRIYYVSLSTRYPCPIDETIAEQFAQRREDIEADLYPVLNVADRPALEEMIENAGLFITSHVAPKEDEEKEYLRLLDEESYYEPGLLFSPWPTVLKQAVTSPAALWKVQNLRNRPASPPNKYPEW